MRWSYLDNKFIFLFPDDDSGEVDGAEDDVSDEAYKNNAINTENGLFNNICNALPVELIRKGGRGVSQHRQRRFLKYI